MNKRSNKDCFCSKAGFFISKKHLFGVYLPQVYFIDKKSIEEGITQFNMDENKSLKDYSIRYIDDVKLNNSFLLNNDNTAWPDAPFFTPG